MISLRRATLDDADDLFAWRNDPVTCANSRSSAPIQREVHDRWMKFAVSLGYPEHIVLIGGNDDLGNVGVVRFDADRTDLMTYEVSIMMAPHYRGWGLGEELLAQGCYAMRDFRLIAEVKPDNKASRRIFSQCGFSPLGEPSSNGLLGFVREAQ